MEPWHLFRFYRILHYFLQREDSLFQTVRIKGKSDFSRISKHKDLGQLIEDVCADNTPKLFFEVLSWFWKSNGFKISRAELFYRIGKIYVYMTEENTTLYETIEELSCQQYFIGKRFPFSVYYQEWFLLRD